MGRLIEKITEYSNSEAYPFHMPGHKRRKDGRCLSGMPEWMKEAYRYDITEIPGFDDLHDPQDILSDLGQKACKLYGADQSYVVLNGSTGGLLMALSAATNYKDEILLARNSHEAVYHAVELRGLRPTYLYPDETEGNLANWGINGPIKPELVEEKLRKNPALKAVVITSPTYEGICSDVHAIAQIVHQYGIPLIVDAAHGAHLITRTQQIANPMEEGADVVVMSLHKTLPACTQSALVVSKGNRVSEERLSHFYDVYMSSSPSYLMLCSVEACLDYMLSPQFALDWQTYEERLQDFYDKTKNLKHLWVLRDMESVMDSGKLIIASRNRACDGIWLENILRNEFQLQMELVSKRYVLAMTSICDSEEGFHRLERALHEIDDRMSLIHQEEWGVAASALPHPRCVYTIAEAENRSLLVRNARTGSKEAGYENENRNVTSYKLAYEQAMGRMSCDYVIPYPPGIPILVPGEVVDASVIAYMKECEEAGIRLMGITEGKLRVLDEG